MKSKISLVLGLLAVALVVGQDTLVFAQNHDIMHHSFQEIERWVKVFEDPGRDAWQKPDRVIQVLSLKPGQTAADIGAGTGYFSRRLSKAVGQDGAVFAVDIEPEMLSYIQKRTKEGGLGNIVTVLAAAEDPMLPPNSADVVLIVNTIHHIEDRVAYFEVLATDLREDGRIAIVDFYKDKNLPAGPSKRGRLRKSKLVLEAEAAGYSVAQEFDFLPYQYFVIFTRK